MQKVSPPPKTGESDAGAFLRDRPRRPPVPRGVEWRWRWWWWLGPGRVCPRSFPAIDQPRAAPNRLSGTELTEHSHGRVASGFAVCPLQWGWLGLGRVMDSWPRTCLPLLRFSSSPSSFISYCRETLHGKLMQPSIKLWINSPPSFYFLSCGMRCVKERRVGELVFVMGMTDRDYRTLEFGLLHTILCIEFSYMLVILPSSLM
jgi:hypothetical protein